MKTLHATLGLCALASVLVASTAQSSALRVPLSRTQPRGDGPAQPPTQFAWMHSVEEVSPAYLTVLAQTVSPNDNDTLLWDQFMPRQDVNSHELKNITPADFRPAADRRSWGARGRRIPLVTPKKRDLEIEPIESNFRIDEKEMNKLIERYDGNQQLIQNSIKATIPQRVLELAQANYRRVELDTMQSWYAGIVTVRNPETNDTYDAQFNFAEERMAMAGTAWNANGVRAYKEFIAWMNDAQDMVGPLAGAALRLRVRQAILDDAPLLAGGVSMSLANLEDRIQQDLGSPFRFYLMEQTVDVFTDGGVATTRVKKWADASKIAAVPADKQVGTVAFAPVARAVMLNAAVPQAKIDVRGCSVFPEAQNNGRELDTECQLDAFPVPNENRIAVMDTGIN